jgi:hypothetical protein
MREAALAHSRPPPQIDDPAGYVWRMGELFMRREIYADERRHAEHIDLGGEGD